MRSLTATWDRQGYWDVRHGRTRLCIVVPSNLDISLGVVPTSAVFIEAVQQAAPAYGATAMTHVTVQSDYVEAN